MKKTTNLTQFILLCSVILTLCIGESLIARYGHHYGQERGYHDDGHGHYGHDGHGYRHHKDRWRGRGERCRGAAIHTGAAVETLATDEVITSNENVRAQKKNARNRAQKKAWQKKTRQQKALQKYDRQQLRSEGDNINYDNAVARMDGVYPETYYDDY